MVKSPAQTRYGAEILPDDHWWMSGRAAALEQILRSRVPRGGAALDVGAGTGLWAERFLPRFDFACLLEPDDRLQKAIRMRELDAAVISAMLPGPLPFADNSFAFISCLDVLEHIDDDTASMDEFFRILRPGGYLLLTVPAHPHLWSDHDESVGHKRRYMRDQLVDLTSGPGFSVQLISPFNVWLFPMAWILRKLNRTGDNTPPAGLNQAMARVFGSEGRLVGKWPGFVRGLSWILLAHRLQ